jgi:hypothetical protein
MNQHLFPRPPRRMKQPREDQLRDLLRDAAETIERQAREIEHLRRPWWRRLLWRAA